MRRLARGWMFTVVVVAGAFVALEGTARSQASPATRLEVGKGSRAEYRVREQLARLNFPNDAVGTTESVAGAIVINPALTAVMSGASHGTTPLIAASGYDVLALGVAAGLGLAKPGGAFRRRTRP